MIGSLRPGFEPRQEVALDALLAVGIALAAAIALVLFAAFDGFGTDFKKLGEDGDPSATRKDD
ncbi:hypothetical protein [Leisingera sp. JC11]|uniref:hypothetical protein n=1 Tax=Leisingera sp. JC11 TaxID=3042469 RepID=UPI003455E9DF